MTVMFGLEARLRAARTMWVPTPGASARESDEAAKVALDVGADMVIVRSGETELRERAARLRRPMAPIIGGGRATYESELVLAASPAAVPAIRALTSPVALVGSRVRTDKALTGVVGDHRVSFLVVEAPLVARAAELAPVADATSVPWFAAAHSTDVSALIADGARRILVQGREGADALPGVIAALADAWDTPELERAAIQGLAKGAFVAQPNPSDTRLPE